MKIVYFTTAQQEDDFRSFINDWKISLNPSNQNFHNKLIRALAVNNEVHVISVRPFSRSNMKVSKLPKEVKHVVLISIALIFTVAIIFLCYYKEILGIWY